MSTKIDFKSYPINLILSTLLKDRTTGKNIIFATEQYKRTLPGISEKSEITKDLLNASDVPFIQPRVTKTLEEQVERTKRKAEVFTPSWLCNRMNNHCDEEWFGRPAVFNRDCGQTWDTNRTPIEFIPKADWKRYVQSPRLEITCGEAPYVVSRYDTTTGEVIATIDRIGILDRKLRVVNENTKTKNSWLIWSKKAFQSVYGYEFQGDNLLIARVNLLLTFCDYMRVRWNEEPDIRQLQEIANIISWNFWQMDGFSLLVPFGKPKNQPSQLDLFSMLPVEQDSEQDSECMIFDWERNQPVLFRTIKG